MGGKIYKTKVEGKGYPGEILETNISTSSTISNS